MKGWIANEVLRNEKHTGLFLTVFQLKELRPYWTIPRLTIDNQCQRSVPMEVVCPLRSKTESKGAEVGVVGGHVACVTFMQKTRVCLLS